MEPGVFSCDLSCLLRCLFVPSLAMLQPCRSPAMCTQRQWLPTLGFIQVIMLLALCTMEELRNQGGFHPDSKGILIQPGQGQCPFKPQTWCRKSSIVRNSKQQLIVGIGSQSSGRKCNGWRHSAALITCWFFITRNSVVYFIFIPKILFIYSIL